MNGNKIRLPEAIILPVNAGIWTLSISPKLTPQGAPVGPRGKHNIAINNTCTGGSPRLLHSQQVDAELAHLTPDQCRPTRNELATGATITKSAHIERAKANTGNDIRAATDTTNIKGITQQDYKAQYTNELRRREKTHHALGGMHHETREADHATTPT